MAISHLGTYLQLTAAPWLMLQMTGSPLMVSLVTTALFLPRLVLTLPAGVLSDVFDRRTVLLVAHCVNGATVAALAVTTARGGLTPTSLLFYMSALGVGTAFATPSYQTLVPDLVPARLRAQAITMNSAAHQSALILGPSLGGVLVAFGIAEAAFAANSASFVLLVAVLFTLPHGAGGAVPASGASGSNSFTEGFRFVRANRGLQRLIFVAAAYTLTSASLQALLPNVVADDLGGDASAFGLLYAVFGAGALLATISRERVAHLLGARLLPTCIAVFAVAAFVFGAALNLITAGLALLVAGLTWVWTLTTFKATVQLLSPRRVRGRVVAVYITAVAMKPVGAFLSGAVGELTGAGGSVMVAASVTLVLSYVTLRARLPVLGRDGVPRTSVEREVTASSAPDSITPALDPPARSTGKTKPAKQPHRPGVATMTTANEDRPARLVLAGQSVPALGLGCMGMSAPGRDDKESLRTLRAAHESGVRVFDTADKYGKGHNEQLLCRGLAAVRNEVVLATKVGFVGSPGDERPVDGRPEHVRAACDRSLERLGVERIDLLYLHRVDPLVPIEETVGALGELASAGKVGAIGLSEVSPSTLERAAAVHPIAAVQSEYSLWSREVEEEVLSTCARLGVTFVAYSPLGIGFLTGRYQRPEELPEGNRLARQPRMSGTNLQQNLTLLEELEVLASARDLTPAQLALAWVLDRGVLAIPGSSTRKHLDENQRAATVALDDDVRARLEEAFASERVAGARKGDAGLALVR